MPGRRGPGRGPAPVARRVVRKNHAKKAAHAADENQKKAAETKEESPPKKEEETKVVSYECEYPRCEKPPEYGFKDKASYAQFCADHKSDDMVFLIADPEHPQESSLERVKQYKKMEPELIALEGAPGKATACRAEVKKLTGQVYKEDSDIQTITKGIQELDTKLAEQAHKPKVMGGKTLFGKGIFIQDQNIVDGLEKDKTVNEGKMMELKGRKVIHDSRLKTLKEELPGLEKNAADYTSTKETMEKFKTTAIENEASALYLQLKSKGMKKEMHAEGEVIFLRLLAKAA
mmetsp:Transcript_7027/g.12607  ORF Transcript_7027/g.12607 Transcript_7027/m.12607 type:complete len:289 (-) Transcript_7027:159-1025(-)|eukprot:CAMPEP_0198292536 /NCGR_PEP_ID=MMETSP1449-20131203/12626_1 /TAXON_ID=420275 /ORGANISM="Attheya septentrionalis, Strain CCMP2084" /LENGTH=288 /DNA_ID=CAMNT_0043991667 /DNA_START=122 /DNA_END=988 /DNA_ORIENTATION=+